MEHLRSSAILSIIFLTQISRCQIMDLSFPRNFGLGVATSAYQIEGAWNISGKGENLWDRFTHDNPQKIHDGSNGDIACDSYHKYLEDVQWIKEIGMDHYRFSISWTRILPTGFANNINRDGIRYYKNLIRALLANGIQPLVTLYHWDHPEILEEMGGWTNELMVQWYADYARVIFREFGHMVKVFMTINEPTIVCSIGYNSPFYAPGKVLDNVGLYLCVHNMLKAHAIVYHMYHDEFDSNQNGQIGIVTNCAGWVPGENTTEQSIEQAFQFDCGWVMHPIYIGDYPEIMKMRIALRSESEGREYSRLPIFSRDWIEYIKGTADFFGLNHYTSSMPVPVSDFDPALNGMIPDSGILNTYDSSWPITIFPFNRVVPAGFGNVLRKIRDEYNNPLLYVTENGYADAGEYADYNRTSFFHDYIFELLMAIKRDGCNIQKYTVWSLMDNLEWSSGYTIHFGIVNVDFDSPNRTRRAKLSTKWWQEVTRTRTLQDAFVDSTRRQLYS